MTRKAVFHDTGAFDDGSPITAFPIGAAAAGSGLAESSGVLAVNVDGSTIEISSDSLRVKAGGIGANEIAATAVAAGSYGDATHVGAFTVDADGRLTAASSVAITGGGGTGLLAVVKNVTGGTKTTTSASLADVDATNSLVTFTAPASGNVLVRVTITGSITSATAQNGQLGLRESTTNVAAATDAIVGVTGTFETVSWVAYITGISAGSHTYKLAFASTGGASFAVFQGSADPVTFEVWAAP